MSRTCAIYGGLRKEIPITFWAMMAGTLAITGVGIAGVFGCPRSALPGFYSKDAIIESSLRRGHAAARGSSVCSSRC